MIGWLNENISDLAPQFPRAKTVTFLQKIFIFFQLKKWFYIKYV